MYTKFILVDEYIYNDQNYTFVHLHKHLNATINTYLFQEQIMQRGYR
jgi:DNA polymerase III alpha subunit